MLIETIRTGVDVNTLDEISGNAPIHAIVTGRKRKDKMELLLALMVYGKVNINLPNSRNMTALHLAIEVMDFIAIGMHYDIIIINFSCNIEQTLGVNLVYINMYGLTMNYVHSALC